MKTGNIYGLAMAIVTVALVTTIVRNANTAGVVRAAGAAFSGSLRAAMGR